MHLLENARQHILTNNPNNLDAYAHFLHIQLKENKNDKLDKYPLNTFTKTRYIDILEFVDYALIKVYCQFKREDKLKTLLQNKNEIFVKNQNIDKKIEKSFEKTNLSVLAYFYENGRRYEEALRQWKKIAQEHIKS